MGSYYKYTDASLVYDAKLAYGANLNYEEQKHIKDCQMGKNVQKIGGVSTAAKGSRAALCTRSRFKSNRNSSVRRISMGRGAH